MSENDTQPTPNSMPGAAQTADSTTKAEPSAPDAGKGTDKADAPSAADLSPEERKELERYRAIHKDEKLWEKRAKQNFDDAERWRKLFKQAGGDGEAKEFDPQAEFQKLRDEVNAERTARIRAEVARTEGLDPEDFSGTTEEEMRASAQRFKAKVQAQVEAALAAAKKPAAAPASEVTSNGKVDGPRQITSSDELKNMSPKDRVAAYKDGRLDALMGKH